MDSQNDNMDSENDDFRTAVKFENQNHVFHMFIEDSGTRKPIEMTSFLCIILWTPAVSVKIEFYNTTPT